MMPRRAYVQNENNDEIRSEKEKKKRKQSNTRYFLITIRLLIHAISRYIFNYCKKKKKSRE